MSGKGVVSFISNHSWVSEASSSWCFANAYFESFDKLWIENLHGNRKIFLNIAPDGRTSETIFCDQRRFRICHSTGSGYVPLG